ncbi:MAG: hypothetical protein WCT24_00120 [Patescibacteria group bacterium]
MSFELQKGENAFEETDLLQIAADRRGFGLDLGGGTHRIYSTPLKVYTLTDDLLSALKRAGFEQINSPDGERSILTLVDTRSHDATPGYRPSNYWNFRRGPDGASDLTVTLCFIVALDIARRGVVLWPQAIGPVVSPSDAKPNFHMFEILVKNDPDALPIAKKMAESNGSIAVSWTELGLGGLRSLSELFREFAGGNEALTRLARSGMNVFQPNPLGPPYLYIAEPAQPELFDAWRAQLNKFVFSLRLRP